jgi:putative endonuclease
MGSRELGAFGEAAAERYLLSRGYGILARGWRIKGGEIDLIAEHGGEVVFVEVKTRYPGEYGDPEEAVTAAKRVRLRRAVFAWLGTQPTRHRRFRIDVIALRVDPDGGKTRLKHIMNAVGESG